jgi:hypothetical protein
MADAMKEFGKVNTIHTIRLQSLNQICSTTARENHLNVIKYMLTLNTDCIPISDLELDIQRSSFTNTCVGETV